MGELSKKIKGRIEQGVGGLTGNKALQKEGEDDERRGQVEGVKHAATGAVKDAKRAFKEIAK